jgi:hypothetical protein
VRAKAKIRETPIPYEVPTPQELPERLGAVLHVIYLVFNEGYSAAAGAEVMRAELTGEAIRLGRLLTELRPAPKVMGPDVKDPEVIAPEVMGLLSLMLLQESRHAARTSPTGELILLENQDRALWNKEQIAEGVALLEKALKSRRFGAYTLQAAIAAVHAEAESVAVTIGGRLLCFTTDCYEFSLRQWYSSIVPWQLQCAMVQRPVWRISTRCWNMANWQIITSRIPPVQICTGGSAGQPRLVLPMRRHWR